VYFLITETRKPQKGHDNEEIIIFHPLQKAKNQEELQLMLLNMQALLVVY